ncbi:unnamed protein product [Toxocara canis]|uniref:Uncharacterized protein n=1 Tax=Toxocara canis TaxID=6265 RepID=A0A183V8F6_TOXCA|nr:unnamed protein product [Toxocara canis]
MGHLFCPEPPTPAPAVKITEGADPERHTAAENAEFNALRDSHYANMFAHAMKMKKEMEAMENKGNERDAVPPPPQGESELGSDVALDATVNGESTELDGVGRAKSKDGKNTGSGEVGTI